MSQSDKGMKNRVSDSVAAMEAVIARRRATQAAKEEERRQFWQNYYEQLNKGNSNIGSGAARRGSAHRPRPFRFQ